jgi:hypothetical protein
MILVQKTEYGISPTFLFVTRCHRVSTARERSTGALYQTILADNDSSSADQQLYTKSTIVLARTRMTSLGRRSAGVQVLVYKASWHSR